MRLNAVALPSVLVTALWLASPSAVHPADDDVYVGHAIAMHGQPKYGPDFKHFDYVNPSAPKGGTVREAAIDTFDSLHPFLLKGVDAAGLGVTFATLTISSADEAFTRYGYVAETIEMPKDRSWVAFTLRKEARFHDGSPITAEDVIWTFEMLKTKGHPFYRAYYANVVTVEKVGERTVRFSFQAGDNRELPLIVSELPVLSKASFEGREFDKTTLEPLLGSGPYKVAEVDPGNSITYARVKDFWAADLPIMKGRFNFDTIRFEYYREQNVALEAFKAGDYDFRVENNSKMWATAYDAPPVRDGRIKLEMIPHERPTGMQGFAYNIRREMFKDPRVREALGYAFDFEWSNKTLFYGQYDRTESYYSNSELASRGLPGREELEILEPYRGRIPDDVFTKAYEPPTSDGSGNIRDNLRKGLKLLKDAGWVIKDGKMVHGETGKPLAFEILLVQPAFERVALPFTRNLKRLGVEATVRVVDTAQYKNRLDQFDFDMIVHSIGQSLSPGNEQRDFWSSESADIPGGRNIIGIKDAVVDELVDLVITAPDREALINRTRALDRVLLWGHYVIPHWHIRSFRAAYWDKFGRPAIAPKYDLPFESWWVDVAREEALKGRRQAAD